MNIITDMARALHDKCFLLPFQKVEDASQEASSNAVAQLQTNQQDPSIPMRVCSSTEMLTAQDVLSFEMLKISENSQAETELETEVTTLTHQPTPTPHNTPLGKPNSNGSPYIDMDPNYLPSVPSNLMVY